MSDRHLVVIDIETTGLDPEIHVPIEVAAINLDTNEIIAFAPYVDPTHLATADYDALRITRYFERGVYKNMLSYDATVMQYQKLWDMLERNTFAGANPRFDAQMLLKAPGSPGHEAWHYRLADVSAYAAGAAGLYPSALEGLADCCKRFELINDEPHSALADAKATAAVFRKAMAR